jgi:phosphoenolpyruvate synthase/pyruvate phosphate dikinase
VPRSGAPVVSPATSSTTAMPRAGGEVLVCTTTTPVWTPLFPSLAALVTDTGGVPCHAAVVAREYGLPAVVGAEVATQRIPDGALVRVDGQSGEVEILRRER